MNIDIREDLYKREKYLNKIRGFYHECEIIKVLSGVRRCGKSSIMNFKARLLNEFNILLIFMMCVLYNYCQYVKCAMFWE